MDERHRRDTSERHGTIESESDGKTSTTASKWPSPSPLTLSGADCGSEFQDTGATE
ncbi:hypothetical protein CSHISOI_09055 [Colletotrichum shisoi]|uniref:Uncharacterized protein n=1 Tax=Colletotrichum shisoi TaxID=2078593 RepID=A0A5Q4BHY0_9PEZI|nr:hypothetical protein CSHISOI_09055 [Colletotrichum shisoi]